jgi:PAS domain S-box-containing protein
MERRLKENEATYRLLVENIPDVVWSANQDGQNTFVSHNLERVCGYTPEEIYHGGKRFWLGIIHPDDVDQVREAYEALFQGNMMLNLEYRIQRKDGEWMWLHNRAIATYDKNGVISADGMFSDITARKRADAERASLISALQDALAQVKTLSGLLPICASCKKIRDDQGYWNRIEAYIQAHSDAKFTHGICPECMKELCPDKY